MTFKHVKFEDSAVMRSLEKVASEKGWTKSDPLKKTASKQTDLLPTTNLTENILKLCSGLRQEGFSKYADELEDKFVVYKQAAAATLYETTSEEGKDLVDAAHPKGSHHLEDVDSDEAVIETILDQHLKDTKMVEKTPTGKLASKEEILNAVRVALGGAAEFTAGQLGASSWSRLLGLLGRTAPAIELATPGAGAGAAAAVGGGEAAAGGAAAVGVGAMGALAGAVLVGAIGGALVGNALFNHYLAPDDLKDAGEKLLEKCKDMHDDLPAGANNAAQDFSIVFNKIMETYPVIEQLQKSKDPKDLPRLKALSDLLWKSNKIAQTIWGWAQSAADDSWKPRFFTGTSDVVALARNWMDRTNELTSLIDKFVRDAAQIVETKVKEQVASKGGEPVVDVQKGYTDTLAELEKYKQVVKAKRLDNANTLIAWLDKVKGIVTAENTEFSAVPDANKPNVAKYYSDRLNGTIKPKIKAFVDKWIV